MNKRIISYKRFNPNFHHIKEESKNDDIRFIWEMGGSSSSKSLSDAQHKVIESICNGYNTMVFRKTGATIADSVYKTYQEAIKLLKLWDYFSFHENIITCLITGAYIKFKGLDDPEKIKGLESYQYVVCEEISEFDESDFKQIKKRLRGRKGQKIYALFNPVSENHWIKKNIFDKENLIKVDNNLYGKLKDNINGSILPIEYSKIKAKYRNQERNVFNPKTKEYDVHPPDMVVLQSNYLNNFWIVGSPDGTYGYYDRQVIADFEKDKLNDPYYYQVYGLGEWGTIKTGGEFWTAFESIHKGKYIYDPSLPIHISLDNNVLPYISVSFWQICLGNITKIRQIHEIPAADPFNTVTKAAELTLKYLEDINYSHIIFLYGDASTKANNTIDEEKRTFLDKFKDVLERKFVIEERIPKSNPSVSITGEFINAVYSGTIKNVDIGIDENCKISIEDYENVKKDVNGCILKIKVKDKSTGQSYEKYGHFSDCKRYFLSQVLKEEYTIFSLRRKNNKIKNDSVNYYDHSKVEKINPVIEIRPNINGYNVAVFTFYVDGKVYVDDVIFNNQDLSIDILISKINNYKDASIHIECPKEYAKIVRELRQNNFDIRAGYPISNPSKRISAHLNTITTQFLFRSDYDLLPEYMNFMENIFDYKSKESMEAINSLSLIAERIKFVG